MADRRHHYDRAFEAYLQARRFPYVSVDEARRAVLPPGAPFATVSQTSTGEPAQRTLKTFDFVIYGQHANLLIDVKGRQITRRNLAPSTITRGIPSSSRSARAPLGTTTRPPVRPRLENWITRDDLDSLLIWQQLFGEGFYPAIVFVYWCNEQPPDALFQEVFDYQGRWYALRAVTIASYQQHMKVRSPRWRTIDLPPSAFDRISQPFGTAFLKSLTPNNPIFSSRLD
jgi:hypothetical protein